MVCHGDLAGRGVGSAGRRRERGLRSWAEHRVRRSTEREACHQRWEEEAVTSTRGAAAREDGAAQWHRP